MAAASLNSICFPQLKTTNHNISQRPSSRVSLTGKSLCYKPPMAALQTAPAAGLSETFSKLKQQGKVSIFLFCYP